MRARPEHLLDSIHSSGAQICKADRGGDVTYHGPGQLVGYPVLDVPMGPGSVPSFVHRIEQLVIDVLQDLGLNGASRLDRYPGVWLGAESGSPRKICAIGVRVERGRSMHGFALNVDPDLSMFGHIVPCGIPDKAVTSMAAEGVSAPMREVVQAVSERAAGAFALSGGEERVLEREEAAWRTPARTLPSVEQPVAEPPSAAQLDLAGRRLRRQRQGTARCRAERPRAKAARRRRRAGRGDRLSRPEAGLHACPRQDRS